MNPNCTIYKTFDIIGKKWSLVILLELSKGKNNSKRYSVLKKSLPDITPKVLSERLRDLESHSLINKVVDSSVFPVKSTYSLTESALELLSHVDSIKKWALKWNIKNDHCDITKCKDCPF